MGCTTRFNGHFHLDREPPLSVLKRLRELEDAGTRSLKDGIAYPGQFCQWVVTKHLDGIEWDQNEKFYEYTEWLQWIIDEILKPAGINLFGRVEFQGEDVQDHGWLVVEDDQHVRVEKTPEVQEEFDELRRFKDFVLSNEDWRDEIIERWREHNG